MVFTWTAAQKSISSQFQSLYKLSSVGFYTSLASSGSLVILIGISQNMENVTDPPAPVPELMYLLYLLDFILYFGGVVLLFFLFPHNGGLHNFFVANAIPLKYLVGRSKIVNVLYVAVVIITTVGYGDLVPSNKVLAVIVIVCSFFYGEPCVRNFLDMLFGSIPSDRAKWWIALVSFPVLLLIGGVGIHFLDIDEDKIRKSFPESLVLALSTLTTVGFGDDHFHTSAGKVFAILWIYVGTHLTAKSVEFVHSKYNHWRLHVWTPCIAKKWNSWVGRANGSVPQPTGTPQEVRLQLDLVAGRAQEVPDQVLEVPALVPAQVPAGPAQEMHPQPNVADPAAGQQLMHPLVVRRRSRIDAQEVPDQVLEVPVQVPAQVPAGPAQEMHPQPDVADPAAGQQLMHPLVVRRRSRIDEMEHNQGQGQRVQRVQPPWAIIRIILIILIIMIIRIVMIIMIIWFIIILFMIIMFTAIFLRLV